MTTSSIDYYYSVRSSFTYLGSARLNALAERRGVKIRHYPIDLGLVVSSFHDYPNQQPLDRAYAGARIYESSPTRESYTQKEYRRWSQRLGIPINVDPTHHYGARELPSGSVIVAQRRGLDTDRLSHAILQALWRDDLDIASEAVMADLLLSVGIQDEPKAFFGEALSEDVQQEFLQNSKKAMEAGVFGSPSYLFNGELFFGQDRLDFLEEWISQSA